MAERKYYCLNCECKMDCIVLNLHSDTEICLKMDSDVESKKKVYEKILTDLMELKSID